MASLFCVRRYSAPKTRPIHGNSCSNARLPFQIDGWRRLGDRKSTLAADAASAKFVGWAFGSGLNKPPTDGQALKPLVPQPTIRVATPGLANGFDIQTVAAAPWNRPKPPRNWVGRALSNL